MSEPREASAGGASAMQRARWLRFGLGALAVGLCCVTLSACKEADASLAFTLELRAVDDRQRPLAGVAFAVEERKLGSTDGLGLARAQWRGEVGQRLSLSVACPEQHVAPKTPVVVELKPLYAIGGDQLRPIEQVVSCERSLREVVLLIEGHPGLPVLLNGRKLGALGPSGVLHQAVQASPGTQLQLQLDTSESPGLKPRSPGATLKVVEDDLLVFSQRFEEPKPLRRAVRQAKPAEPSVHIPRRL